MSTTNGVEESIFFIKTEAMPKENEIINRLYEASIPVTKVRHFTMTPGEVEALYSDKPEVIRKKLHEQLDNKLLLIGLVRGTDIINRLADLVGRESAPAKCKPDTLRFAYGNHDPQKIHENAIHRPKTKDEVQQNLLIFRKYLK